MEQKVTLIKDLKPGMKNINVIFIILEVGQLIVTKANREVRTFKVADKSASINASIWDEANALLVPGDIVKLTKGYASSWRNCLTLYTSKYGDLQKVGEFCLDFNEELNMSEPIVVIESNSPNSTALNNGTNVGADAIGPSMLPPNTYLPTPSTPHSNTDGPAKFTKNLNPRENNSFHGHNNKYKRSRWPLRDGSRWLPQK